jgi:hypothetical protein
MATRVSAIAARLRQGAAARHALAAEGALWQARRLVRHGLFHFDHEGQIVGKFSYASYGPRPQVRSDLG